MAVKSAHILEDVVFSGICVLVIEVSETPIVVDKVVIWMAVVVRIRFVMALFEVISRPAQSPRRATFDHCHFFLYHLFAYAIVPFL